MTVKAVFPVIGYCKLTRLPLKAPMSTVDVLSVTWGITCCKHLTVRTIDFRLFVLYTRFTFLSRAFLKNFSNGLENGLFSRFGRGQKPPLAAMKRTRVVWIWPDTQRERVGLRRTRLDTAGLCGTNLHIRERVCVWRRAILTLDSVHILVISTSYNYNYAPTF